MKISKEAIQEFIDIYSKKKGKTLSFTEASKMSNDWLSFYLLIKQKQHLKTNEYEKKSKYEK